MRDDFKFPEFPEDEWDDDARRAFVERMNHDIRDLAAATATPYDMVVNAAVRERGEAQAEEIFAEAIDRWWNDPVLHARAVMAAQQIEARERWIHQADGPDSIRDVMRLAAAVALVLAERDPTTGAKRDPATGERPEPRRVEREIGWGDEAPIRVDVVDYVVPGTNRRAELCPECGAPKWLDEPCTEH